VKGKIVIVLVDHIVELCGGGLEVKFQPFLTSAQYEVNGELYPGNNFT
jgi:hypothetical protein